MILHPSRQTLWTAQLWSKLPFQFWQSVDGYIFFKQCGVIMCLCASQGPGSATCSKRFAHNAYRHFWFDSVKYFSEIRRPQLWISRVFKRIGKFSSQNKISVEHPVEQSRLFWEMSKVYSHFAFHLHHTVAKSRHIDCITGLFLSATSLSQLSFEIFSSPQNFFRVPKSLAIWTWRSSVWKPFYQRSFLSFFRCSTCTVWKFAKALHHCIMRGIIFLTKHG